MRIWKGRRKGWKLPLTAGPPEELDVDVWDFRVLHHRDQVNTATGFDVWDTYQIVEAYYGADGAVKAWTDAIRPTGDSVEDLRTDLYLMIEATSKPVIDLGAV